MIVAMLLMQVTVDSIDRRPQRAVPATAFRCTMLRADDASGAASQIDLYGLIPVAPEGHQPNDRFPIMLSSASDSPLAGRASFNPGHASDWFRDFQITRIVGQNQYVINLRLRREGQSIAYMTMYSDWPANAEGEREPFRYDAVGLCTANFSPSEQR